MNLSVLSPEAQHFIEAHLNSDINALILKGSPFPELTIQELCVQIEAKKRCKTKLSHWYQTENIYYPNRLNIEQTSSEKTALYKSSLVSGDVLIDTTGGFGVDVFFFSRTMKNVVHCELNPTLSQIATHNYRQFKKENIQCIATNGIEYITQNEQQYDWIYSDPSRRNDLKGKVFLLEDCLPNLPKHLHELFKKTRNILVKVSPVLDLTSAIRELDFVKEIHIVAVHNEVKELLFILEKDYTQDLQIKTVNLAKNGVQNFGFTYKSFVEVTYEEAGNFLYEPNSAILKSGGFNEVAAQYQLAKLHPHSHLYTSDSLIKFPGRRFKIIQQTNYNKKKLGKLIPSKKANITTRNFPETVAQIRKKTGLKDGGDQYLFFTTNSKNERIVLICERIDDSQ